MQEEGWNRKAESRKGKVETGKLKAGTVLLGHPVSAFSFQLSRFKYSRRQNVYENPTLGRIGSWYTSLPVTRSR